MMAYVSLLLIAILTVAIVGLLHSTVLMYSHQLVVVVTTLISDKSLHYNNNYYCIIDNCTIMRIDTRQHLDIVYTTGSLLIVTPKDGHTSIAISKIDDELPTQLMIVMQISMYK